MEILLLTTHLNVGGIGVYTVNLAKWLARKGLKVSVASSGGDLEGLLASGGIEHIRLDIMTKSEFGPKTFRALPALVRILKSRSFDIIHAQTRVSQVLACLSSRITGVPFVTTCHGFFNHRRLSRRLFPCWGDRVIAISDSVKRHLVNDFKVDGLKVDRVYNGIELDRYFPETPAHDDTLMVRMGLADPVRVVGTVGRLSPVKGIKYLIKAFAAVADVFDDVRLVIMGEGSEEKKLRERASRLGVEDKVIFSSGESSLEGYLSVFDVFCLTSLNEGLGLSLMEAMAAGKPCVASDVGGLAELIDDGRDGFLVPPGDPAALSGAIIRLLGDAAMREEFGRRAREKARERFSMEESADGTIKVYEQALRSARSGSGRDRQ